MDQPNVIGATALQTAEALAPVILAAAGTALSPQTAAIVALAPIALSFLQSATQLEQAGAMTPAQLASLFLSIGQGVQSTHDKWVAMNAADAAPR
jgi:hypothetical protein